MKRRIESGDMGTFYMATTVFGAAALFWLFGKQGATAVHELIHAGNWSWWHLSLFWSAVVIGVLVVVAGWLGAYRATRSEKGASLPLLLFFSAMVVAGGVVAGVAIWMVPFSFNLSPFLSLCFYIWGGGMAFAGALLYDGMVGYLDASSPEVRKEALGFLRFSLLAFLGAALSLWAALGLSWLWKWFYDLEALTFLQKIVIMATLMLLLDFYGNRPSRVEEKGDAASSGEKALKGGEG